MYVIIHMYSSVCCMRACQRCVQPYTVFTLVLLRNVHQDGRKGGKLTKWRNGPHKITCAQNIQSKNPKSGEKDCQHLQAETFLFW